MKHLEQTLATYMYSHCNICDISIYFCNIHTKHLQHTSETYEILKTYAFSKSWSTDGWSTAHRDPAVRSRWRMAAADGCATLSEWLHCPSERHLQWRRQWWSDRYGITRRGTSGCAAVREHATAVQARRSTPWRCWRSDTVALQHARMVWVQQRGHAARRS